MGKFQKVGFFLTVFAPGNPIRWKKFKVGKHVSSINYKRGQSRRDGELGLNTQEVEWGQLETTEIH